MSDAAYHQELVFRLASPPRIGDSIKAQIDRAYLRLRQALKQAGKIEERERWTWRRVKALWYLEVLDQNIRTHETRELELAAAIYEARKAHGDFIAETERMAAIGSIQDEAFYRDYIEARRRIARGLGLPGVGGDTK